MHIPSTTILTLDNPSFPIQARSMSRPPDRLFLRGRLPASPGIAIVGTRGASDEALRFARRLAYDLAAAGIVIWSGGAAGIDGAAHAGALEARGTTVVVMGTGFDHAYPADHRDLFNRVLDGGGAWLSQMEPSKPGARWSFLRRNELLASLVAAVVLVQAPVRSGARSTTAAARKLGTPVWAVPSAPWDRLGAGCVAELRRGARVCDGSAVLLAEWGRGNRQATLGDRESETPPPPPPSEEPLSPVERAVLEAVGSSRVHPDEVCEKTRLPPGLVLGALLTLTLGHVVVEGSDGSFQRITY